METLEKAGLAPQEDALQLYLRSLLDETSLLSEEAAAHGEASENSSMTLFDLILKESRETDEHIKRPRWATDYFSCLPVKVGATTLFVPLRQVRTVVPLKQNIHPLEGVPEWVTGSMVSFSRNLRVVDLQKIIQQDLPGQVNAATGTASQLVIINDGKSGISCHEVEKVQQLNVEDVVWRAKNAKRRWVSGVSVKHERVIVDGRRIEFAMAMESCLA
ncbi:MAG TPA: hypothetical protein ENK06_00905 [Gammaproteobacteria bacterium]|nr:hypothetical protein [Gammaproteobacteria bacterium]